MNQCLPFVIPLTFFFVLPPSSSSNEDEDETLPVFYTALQTADDDGEEEGSFPAGPKHISLSPADKLELVKPLLLKYMLPLCTSFQRPI